MTFQLNGPIVLAGAGKMGAAMLRGWLARGLKPSDIVIQEPAPLNDIVALCAEHGIRVATSYAATQINTPSVIVVAVKPQVMGDVWPGLAKLAGPNTVVMSIAAGIPLQRFARADAAPLAVVRAMPNTPAAIGRGMTGAVGNAHVTSDQRALCHALLSAVGNVVWLEDENLIDAVTAVSGSGPAYVFHLVEAMAAAGVKAGLSADAAMQLARATVSGAGELLHQSPETTAMLRQNVTSPGGTTAAALNVLMNGETGLTALMTDAILAAKKRSEELGSG
jgi:pyrroline-5-carboxylate reductase